MESTSPIVVFGVFLLFPFLFTFEDFIEDTICQWGPGPGQRDRDPGQWDPGKYVRYCVQYCIYIHIGRPGFRKGNSWNDYYYLSSKFPQIHMQC